MESGREFRLRDTRKAGHFWAYNEILDKYGPIIGAYAFAVYMALCRHAIYGECEFTLRQIAGKLDISPQTVMRSIQKLTEAGLVREVEKSTSLYKPSIIQLVDTHEVSTVPIGNSEDANHSYREQLPPPTVPIGNTNTNTNNTKKQDKSLPALLFPDKDSDIIDLPEWKEFCKMRHKLGHPLVTEEAVGRMIGRLREFKAHGQDVKKVLQQSCDRAWTDVWEVKTGKPAAAVVVPEPDALEVMRQKERARGNGH